MTPNCYKCSILTGDCNDPFDKTASGVTTTGLNNTDTYCKKTVVAGIVTGSGATSCETTDFVIKSSVTCCQTDLCNRAQTTYQLAITLIMNFIILFIKMF